MCVTSDQDGAEPSANSVSASNLLRLSHYTGRQEWLQKSQRLLAAFSDRLTRVPIALPEMVRALMAQHHTLKQVIHLLLYFFAFYISKLFTSVLDLFPDCAMLSEGLCGCSTKPIVNSTY